MSDGHVVVACDGERLLGVDLADGLVRWDWRNDGYGQELCALPEGPVVSWVDGDRTLVVALTWAGQERWCFDGDWWMGRDRLAVHAGHVLALGRGGGAQGDQLQVLAGATGRIETTVAGLPELPLVVAGQLVVSVRAPQHPDVAGLFRVDPNSGSRQRLLHDSHWLRVVAGRLVLVDTTDTRVRLSRLHAVDPISAEVAWSGPGGPNLVLNADAEQLASVVALDEESCAVCLREVIGGRELWRSVPFKCRDATVSLAADAVVVAVDRRELRLFDRASGRPLQHLEHRSRLTGGPCLADGALVDAVGTSLVCLGCEG